MIVSMGLDRLTVRNGCDDLHKVTINDNGTITLFKDSSKCITGCFNQNCVLKMSDSEPCMSFSFVRGNYHIYINV